MADLAKEFEVSQLTASKIAWIYSHKFFKQDMLAELIRLDKAEGEYNPDLPLMRWEWKNGKFVKKHPKVESLRSGQDNF